MSSYNKYVDKKVEENTIQLAKSLVDNLRTKHPESTTQELIAKAVELLSLDSVLEFELKSIYEKQSNKSEKQYKTSKNTFDKINQPIGKENQPIDKSNQLIESNQLIDKFLIPLIEESEASAHFVSQVETVRMLVIDLKRHESPSKSTAECINDAVSLLKLDKEFIDVMQTVFNVKQTEKAV